MSDPEPTPARRPSAIDARRHGDAFQARIFWLRAASLLDPASPEAKVAFEAGPAGFDDISVEYEPSDAPGDHEDRPILRRHIQCKWHATAGVFGYQDLIDPGFIHTKKSLLQRAYEAQQRHAPDGLACQFMLLTNWRIKPDDPLLELVRKESDAIDLHRLFDGTGNRSRMGKVRASWREHLGVDDAALRRLLGTLAIAEHSESLDALRERLDQRFATVGIRRVRPGSSEIWYDGFPFNLRGHREFDRESLRTMLEREGLLGTPLRPTGPLDIGIRAFMHPIDPLEDRCSTLLNLVRYFEGRYIRAPELWQGQVLPRMRDFLLNALRGTDHIRLLLDVHASLAFAVGTVLGTKSGKRIEVEQRGGGRQLWERDDQPVDPAWPALDFSTEALGTGDDLILAISLTHDVAQGVRSFVQSQPARFGPMLHCRVQDNPSQQSVRCGRHAWNLTESIVRQVKDLQSANGRARHLHVFAAAPNAFTFFLGQQRQAMGPATTYEYDFDGLRGGGYSAGLSFGVEGGDMPAG